jgi:hypothetical protein
MTGTAKSYLACALVQQACRKGYRVLYRRAGRLYDELAHAKADGSLGRMLARIAKVDVLVIDDFGLGAMREGDRHALLKVWKTATEAGRRSSLASFPQTRGTTPSTTRRLPTPSATESSTTPTASLSRDRRCAGTRPRRTERQASVASLRSRSPIWAFTMDRSKRSR